MELRSASPPHVLKDRHLYVLYIRQFRALKILLFNVHHSYAGCNSRDLRRDCLGRSNRAFHVAVKQHPASFSFPAAFCSCASPCFGQACPTSATSWRQGLSRRCVQDRCPPPCRYRLATDYVVPEVGRARRAPWTFRATAAGIAQRWAGLVRCRDNCRLAPMSRSGLAETVRRDRDP